MAQVGPSSVVTVHVLRPRFKPRVYSVGGVWLTVWGLGYVEFKFDPLVGLMVLDPWYQGAQHGIFFRVT